MVVQHNLRAMNSNRMLGLTANVQSKSTEKLSSGYKINRAADDAAGLSISEKMRKQIRGLSQASLNAADGISAVQTAEGALNEVQDMLQRMNELAVKAANGTMSEDDRSYIQNEIDQLTTEIDRVAETTKFNETYLLKGVEGTDVVETPESVEVTYKADITGEREMTWNGGGQALYAVKDGKSVEVTADNYKDFIELGTKEVVDEIKIATGVTLYDSTGAALTKATMEPLLNNDPATKFYLSTNGAGSKATSTANTAGATGAVLTVTFADLSDDVTAAEQNALQNVMANTGFDVTTNAHTELSMTLAGYNIADDGKVTKAGSDVVLATVSVGGTLVASQSETSAGGNAIKLAAGNAAVAPATIANEDDFTVTYKEVDALKAKEGVTLYKTAAAANNHQYGVNIDTDRADEDDIKGNISVDTDLLLDKHGNAVSAEDLAAHFDEDGNYLNTLFKKATPGGALTQVGADLIGQYVDWNRTEASEEEVAVTNALHFSLQVGADTTENNKISIDIDSMSAKSLGVEGLKVDGKDSKNADAAVDVIAAAIQKVSTQRSALGAVQNRLEHTIANLDNVVENTTAAESQIRDTDMATEMVKFSNNNILAQAGQAMLAQANQANQGVLSLLG